MAITELLDRPGLAPDLRLLVAVAVAIWRGDWPAMQEALRIANDRGQSRQDFEETLLQAVLFCGFPRIVTAFEKLAEVWPADEPPSGGGLPAEEREEAGRKLFAVIYGKNDEPVRQMLHGYHEELHDFVLSAAYGRILSRPHLSGREREILAVGLLAAQNQVRQFVGHARGALNLGATREELHESVVTTFGAGEEQAEEVDAWMSRLRTSR